MLFSSLLVFLLTTFSAAAPVNTPPPPHSLQLAPPPVLLRKEYTLIGATYKRSPRVDHDEKYQYPEHFSGFQMRQHEDDRISFKGRDQSVTDIEFSSGYYPKQPPSLKEIKLDHATIETTPELLGHWDLECNSVSTVKLAPQSIRIFYNFDTKAFYVEVDVSLPQVVETKKPHGS